MIFRRIALLLVVVALVGCNNEKNRNLIDRHADETIRMGQQAITPAPKKTFDPLTVSDKIWSGNASTRLRRGLPLPSRFETNRGVTLISSEDMTLGDIALAIGEQTGIPTRLTDGASGSTSKRRNETVDPEGMGVAYEGTLSGLLDLVASKFGVDWRYDGSSIKFSKYETRVFVIESLPGTQTIKDGIKDDSSSSGGGSSSGSSSSSVSSLSQSAEMNIEFKLWDELQQTLSSMLGGVGTVVLSPSSGTATVTTTPDVMGIVAKYIEEENQRLARQIAINVEIYSVNLADDSDFNMTFNTALKKLTSFGGNITGLNGPASSVSGMGSLSVAILNPNSTGQITTIFSALSSVGDTTRVSQFPLTTLNNRGVSRRIGRQRAYVKSISNTSSGSDYSSSSVETDTIQEGFSLQLTPRLLEDGRIMMQYSLSLNDIIDMPSFDTGSGTVQLPEMSTRTFVQQAMLKSGATLIIGGYDDEQISQTSSGVGNAYNYLLGGGSVNAKSRSMMFIAITPQVLEVPKAEHD
ncbi:MAG: secretin N-terminal domain-containing protein [Alphaproteobacteria bacterium]|nr:secretin N-terminal domain-containing protein [Alphaproteobacteria bacterium]